MKTPESVQAAGFGVFVFSRLSSSMIAGKHSKNLDIDRSMKWERAWKLDYFLPSSTGIFD
jgi:hypothetical protein